MKNKNILLKICIVITLAISSSAFTFAAQSKTWLYVGPIFHQNGVIYCKYVNNGRTLLLTGYPNCRATVTER